MATARPRPQVMRLTDAAADRIKAIIAKADKPIAGVRVGVKNGGCAGMAYTMEYAQAAEKFDEVGEDKLTSYWRMPDRLYDDPDELARWARDANAAAQRAAARKTMTSKSAVRK